MLPPKETIAAMNLKRAITIQKNNDYIDSLTADIFEEWLNSIGWSLKDCGCGIRRLHDNMNRAVPMILNASGTEVKLEREQDSNWGLCFELKNCGLRKHDNDCLTLGPSGDKAGNTIFLQFYSFYH